ncbi:MAG: hypothetical protein ACREFC_03430, partial [Stellaceae bacterium]
MRRLIPLALVALCIGVSPGWTQEKLSNPMVLPKTILAERGGVGDSIQLRLVYDRTRDGKAAGKLSVWIGVDYFAVIDGDRMVISDLRLLRRFVIDSSAGTLVNLSLYGDVMFRRVELVRRMEIATALSHEKEHPVLPESLDRFWIESELGIVGPGKLPAPMEPRQDGETTKFYYGEQLVASVVPSDTEMPRQLKRSYAAFLGRTLPLHPNITHWLGGA